MRRFLTIPEKLYPAPDGTDQGSRAVEQVRSSQGGSDAAVGGSGGGGG